MNLVLCDRSHKTKMTTIIIYFISGSIDFCIQPSVWFCVTVLVLCDRSHKTTWAIDAGLFIFLSGPPRRSPRPSGFVGPFWFWDRSHKTRFIYGTQHHSTLDIIYMVRSTVAPRHQNASHANCRALSGVRAQHPSTTAPYNIYII